ncbi:hypothetical protein HYC85_006104 [Camellia sinensis]|uniref:Uncharacterized protein n=1 Tax=Camellia sinensis TaxID=4442 RepID=A0A7J7I1U4_CAMSI|nr:hypothetical protein HYC85_006104 [Camellia sinensis]
MAMKGTRCKHKNIKTSIKKGGYTKHHNGLDHPNYVGTKKPIRLSAKHLQQRATPKKDNPNLGEQSNTENSRL